MYNQRSKEKLLNNLEILLKKKIDLKINDNKTTFLSLKFLSKDHLFLSLHKCFLSASDEILINLKRYIFFNKKEDLKHLKIYVEKYFLKNPLKTECIEKKLSFKGKEYDLKEIFEEINQIYFKKALQGIKITWFKKPKYTKKRAITFGSYDNRHRLIKINKLLDSRNFPHFFVSYVVYHEILHDIYPYEILENGTRRIHTKKFKEEEKKFYYYQHAKNFEKKLIKERCFYGGT